MIDQRNRLLTELESLQAIRRDAIEAYRRTGDRAYMREAHKLRELGEMRRGDDLADAIDGLMGAKQ